jgi:arylsulfatase A
MFSNKVALTALSTIFLTSCLSQKKQTAPNIIVFLADDAGYSEYQPYNEMFDIPDNVRIKTPNIEKLSKQGMTFTNAHTTGGVCQPTRYSIMTGMYSFRKPITENPIVEGGEPFIEDWRFTIADMFKANGYQTAMVGKWHLDYALSGKENQGKKVGMKKFDHTKPAILTPNDYGFDYVTWMPIGVGGMEFFIENRNIVKLAGQVEYNEIHPDKPNWPGHQRWVFESYKEGEELQKIPGDERKIIGDVLTDKALEYMEEAVTKDKPFYLYFAHTAPHAPHLPCNDINGVPMSKGAIHFNGSEALRERQKLVYENDVIVGQVMEQLKRLGIEDNTILIFTSDNGPGKPGAVSDGATAIYNGHKGTAFEGGNRVPFIVKWPGVVEPGSRNDNLVSQVDLFKTFADIIKAKPFPKYTAQDSKSMLPLFKQIDGVYERQWSFSTKHKVAPYDDYLDATLNLGVLDSKNRKLICYYNHKTDSYEPIGFYNLNNDPGEKINLINDNEFRNDINEMMEKVREVKNKKIE